MAAVSANRRSVRGLWLRVGMFVVCALVALVLMPRWLAPDDAKAGAVALHGQRDGSVVHYRDVPVSLVLEDIDRATGFRVLVFPAVGNRRFTGSIRLDGTGGDAVSALAAPLDLKLKQAGPHWALVEPAG